MPNINATYRARFLKNQLLFENQHKDLFDNITLQFSALVNDPNIRFAKAFQFPEYINKRMDGYMQDFDGKLLKMTEEDIRRTWDLSNAKNDQIVDSYLKTISEIKTTQKAAYYIPNLPALKAFIAGDRGSGTLSEMVWKVGEQLRAEMTVHLGMGIVNGDSAQVISRRIRQYLANPDTLFRRVRNAEGKLVASKAMEIYHPGQGVYWSAYKNAMRISRSETNRAYHLADALRWQQLDMVKGVRVSLSAQHPDYNFPEICEELEGDYPKEFVFAAWHPHCLCHAVAILSSSEDFLNYLETGKREVSKAVTEYPEGFKNYLNTNYERFMNYKTVPYWMSDNYSVVNKIIGQKVLSD